VLLGNIKMPRSVGLTIEESIAIIARSSVTLNYPLTREHLTKFGKSLEDAREKALQSFGNGKFEEQLCWNDFQRHHKGKYFVAKLMNSARSK